MREHVGQRKLGTSGLDTSCFLLRWRTRKILDIVSHYFHNGYENDVILQFLKEYHEIDISLSTLKRRLKDYGLIRNNNTDEERLRAIIHNELKGSGSVA